MPAAQQTPEPVVAIVGGGASGALTAIALLNLAAARQVPLHLVMIDRYGRHGLGQAYATTNPSHLLNAPADQMSAVDGDANHLIRWADCAGIDATGFMPRQDYGRYLRQTLAAAQAQAAPIGTLDTRIAEVRSVSRPPGQQGVRLQLADGDLLDADLVVLALGSLPSAMPFPVPGSDRVIIDPWAPGALDQVVDGRPVVIVGTGLTALDLVLSVTANNQGAAVHAVSRHGLLPRPHLPTRSSGRPVALPGIEAVASPIRLTELTGLVRAAVRANPGDWQDVMDALRPHVPQLWQALSPSDQRVFLRQLARYWEIHRHRVPVATASRIADLQDAGRLTIHRGRIAAVTDQDQTLTVRISRDGRDSTLTAGWLINGTGPGADAARTADPLLASLLATGLVRPDPLGLGIDADDTGAVLDRAGTASGVIFTLGPTLRGRWYETTAVPEIRAQATALARVVLDQLRVCRD